MSRQNCLDDEPWPELHREHGIQSRSFDVPRDAAMRATLHELQPGARGFDLHMHFGREELFFVLSGRPTLRTGDGEEQLAPGAVVHCPEGEAGLHTFTNPTDAPARVLAISAGRYPDVVAYPERGHAWVATRDPDRAPEPGAQGIVARFDLPAE